MLFFFVSLTTVVAEADERFGKAYLRWARPVAISEIKPDLREIQGVFFFYRNHKVATCFHCTARPASQAKVSEVGKKIGKGLSPSSLSSSPSSLSTGYSSYPS